LVKDWSVAERQQLRDDVPRRGFNAAIGGTTVLDLARTCVELARRGLARRDRNDVNGCDETRYLEPVEGYIESGITPAEELLEKYHGPWRGSVEPVFTEYAY
jgi:glutamate--cysteine ligase